MGATVRSYKEDMRHFTETVLDKMEWDPYLEVGLASPGIFLRPKIALFIPGNVRNSDERKKWLLDNPLYRGKQSGLRLSNRGGTCIIRILNVRFSSPSQHLH